MVEPAGISGGEMHKGREKSVWEFGFEILRYLSDEKVSKGEKVFMLCESRAYPHDGAVHDFGYAPMSFEEGLRWEVRDYFQMKNG